MRFHFPPFPFTKKAVAGSSFFKVWIPNHGPLTGVGDVD